MGKVQAWARLEYKRYSKNNRSNNGVETKEWVKDLKRVFRDMEHNNREGGSIFKIKC